MYSCPSSNAMPNGEFSPVMNGVFSSATPSPSASRSSVMRLADGTPAPTRPISTRITQPVIPPPLRGGELVSATSTSPLGRRYSQRGWSSPVAKAATRSPAAAVGVCPCAQPIGLAVFTVGITCSRGAVMSGRAPATAATSCRALSGQANHAKTAIAMTRSRASTRRMCLRMAQVYRVAGAGAIPPPDNRCAGSR